MDLTNLLFACYWGNLSLREKYLRMLNEGKVQAECVAEEDDSPGGWLRTVICMRLYEEHDDPARNEVQRLAIRAHLNMANRLIEGIAS